MASEAADAAPSAALSSAAPLFLEDVLRRREKSFSEYLLDLLKERSSKADLVVQYCIERRIYRVSFINEALYDCGLPLLKTGLKL